ncbi:MAG: FecR family protein [Terriglobales bacterium]
MTATLLQRAIIAIEGEPALGAEAIVAAATRVRLRLERLNAEGWGVVAPAASPAPRPHRTRRALTAAAVALAAALVWAAGAPHAGVQIESVRGGLHRSGNAGLATGAFSDAVLRLADGSQLELDSNTHVRLTQRWGSEVVALDQGRLLIEAAHQGWMRHLYVQTPDCRVAVKGTIFGVAHTVLGSRVSVVEGRVEVASARTVTWLTTNGQITTQHQPSVTVARAIAWSRNAARYLTFLPPPPAPPAPAPAPPTAPPTVPAPPAAPPGPAAAPPLARPTAPGAAAHVSRTKPIPPPAAAPPPPATLNPGQLLFQQARASLDPIPEQDRPVVLSRIVQLELGVFPKQALADDKLTFQMALNLPTPTAANQWLAYDKQNSEEGAVIILVRHHQDDDALALARTADVSRAILYNWLLVLPDPAWSVEKQEALVAECKQSGSFPYDGAMAIAKRAKDDPIVQHAMVGASYAAAAAEGARSLRDLSQGWQAALTGGHAMAPDLDPQLEGALTTIIETIAKNPNPSPVFLPTASKLMAQLRALDSSRAQELSAEYPSLVNNPPLPRQYLDQNAQGKYQRRLGVPPEYQAESLAKTDAPGALAMAAGQKSDLDRFRSLAVMAKDLAKTHPQLAEQAAQDASAMLKSNFLADNHLGYFGAVLAEAEHAIGDEAASHALLLRLLDLADQRAAEYEQTYEAAPLDAPDGTTPAQLSKTKIFMASQLGVGNPTGVITAIYAVAGRLDFPLAVSRVQALPSSVLLPMAEANVAAGWKPDQQPTTKNQ